MSSATQPPIGVRPTATEAAVYEVVGSTGDAGVTIGTLCRYFRRHPSNAPFRRVLLTLLSSLEKQSVVRMEEDRKAPLKRRWFVTGTAYQPYVPQIVPPARYDLDTAGTYVCGPDWMRSSRPGSDDFRRVRSVTFFNQEVQP